MIVCLCYNSDFYLSVKEKLKSASRRANPLLVFFGDMHTHIATHWHMPNKTKCTLSRDCEQSRSVWDSIVSELLKSKAHNHVRK